MSEIPQVLFDTVSEMVDTTLLVSGVDFERGSLDFELAKNITIEDVFGMINNILDDPELSDDAKRISLVSSVVCVVLENFYLHLANESEE